MSDEYRTLTSAIASGDTEAFARFYRQWFDFVLAEAMRVMGADEQTCLDIVQETMLRVIRSIKPLNAEADVQRWLRAVTRSACMDHLRREARRRKREQAQWAGRGDRDADQELAERLAWLHRQLAALDREQARMLSMRYRLGWTLRRIGEALGLTSGAVDGKLSRSIAALRLKAREEFNE